MGILYDSKTNTTKILWALNRNDMHATPPLHVKREHF